MSGLAGLAVVFGSLAAMALVTVYIWERVERSRRRRRQQLGTDKP